MAVRSAAIRRTKVKKTLCLSRQEINAIVRELQNPDRDLLEWRTVVTQIPKPKEMLSYTTSVENLWKFLVSLSFPQILHEKCVEKHIFSLDVNSDAG